MATLRAYLRGLTAAGSPDLCGLMSKLDRLVAESSSSERYATIFYGQLDVSTRKLSYVNAGHPAPLLLRGLGTDSRLIRLDVGGPVIGLLPDCSYAQGTVQIETGDVLVAFTDGISEAMDPAGTEWSEERLIATIHTYRSLGVDDLLRRIMADALAHIADAPQHDDMTLVVLRFIESAR